MASYSSYLIFSLLLILPAALPLVAGECKCEPEDIAPHPNNVTIKFKVGAIVAILVSSAIGVTLPIIGKSIPALRPGSGPFFLIKAFAAGVILSTGFIHILPDAFGDLTNPCLTGPWSEYPFTGLAAMVGALATLMVDAFATGHYTRAHTRQQAATGGGRTQPLIADEETTGKEAAGPMQFHGHGHGHGHSHVGGNEEVERIRHKVTSQVLELGIVVHSVIIGISLGTSTNLDTIKPLMAALCFHQFFEGIGLGGCIAQADFKSASTMCMALFFSLTTPVGVAIGIGIMKVYDDSSPTALIVQGLLNACAAGILVYMALVDLLAQDFMSPKLQASKKLFLGSNLTLLLGAGFMAVLAVWA